VPLPARAVVTAPRPGGRGDYATNIALQLARPAGRPALQVAEILRPHLRDTVGVADVEITGPGFLNIHLDQGTATAALVRQILDEHSSTFGHNSTSGHSSMSSHSSACGHNNTSGHSDSGHDYTCDHSNSYRHSNTYGHDNVLDGAVVPLRIPYDIRAEVVADTLVRIIATQGGRAEIEHARPGEPVDLRPVPAPEDPAPLGPDAARWALLHPAAHDRPRITADHLLQRESNPLFRVRYAHSRARALVRNAARLDFTAAPGDVPDATAAPLTRALAEYPTALAQAAAHRAPDRLARHLVAVADGLLAFQHTVLPLGEEKPSAAHRARLALAEAAGTVLAGGLSLLGISAPDYL
jgi:arginyl-tRNA synthetase